MKLIAGFLFLTLATVTEARAASQMRSGMWSLSLDAHEVASRVASFVKQRAYGDDDVDLDLSDLEGVAEGDASEEPLAVEPVAHAPQSDDLADLGSVDSLSSESSESSVSGGDDVDMAQIADLAETLPVESTAAPTAASTGAPGAAPVVGATVEVAQTSAPTSAATTATAPNASAAATTLAAKPATQGARPRRQAAKKRAKMTMSNGASPAKLFAVAAEAMAGSGAEEDNELGKLEKSILDLSKSDPCPEVDTFVEEIRYILEHKMTKDIWSQFNATNTSLTKQYNAILNCTVDGSMEVNLTDPYVLEARDLLPENYNLTDLQYAHRQCRHNESHWKNHSEVLRGLADAKEALMDRYCYLWDQNESNRSGEVGNWETCVVSETTYPVESASRYIDYFTDMYNFWLGQWQEIYDSRIACEQATEEYQIADERATAAENVYADVKQNCSTIQDTMDDNSCAYKAALEQECNHTSCCVDSGWDCYSESKRQADTEETFLQAQMRAILRIDCYCGTFELENVTQGIEDCKAENYTTHENVTALTFVDYEKPTLGYCLYSKQHIAGYCLYEDLYYNNTFDLNDQCEASCCGHITNVSYAPGGDNCLEAEFL